MSSMMTMTKARLFVVRAGISCVLVCGLCLTLAACVSEPRRSSSGAGLAASAPLAYYGFDNGEVRDGSGHGHHGVSHGPRRTTGKIGDALNFDGQDDYAEVGSPFASGAQKLSIAAWIYKRDGGDDRVVCQSTGTAIADHVLCLGVANQTFRVRINTAENGSGRNYDGGTIALNRWTHLALTYDGAQLRLYKNGQAVRTYPLGGALVSSDQPLVIGNINRVYDRFFNGKIDEVYFYDRALSAGEVAALPTAKPPVVDPIDPSLLVHWTFDEGSGNRVEDQSGAGHQLTLIGDPSWADGKRGGALDLNGVDAYGHAGPVTTQALAQLSASAWVLKRDGGDDRVVCKSTGTQVADHVFCLGIANRTIRVRMDTANNGAAGSYDGGSIGLGQWTQVGFTYDGARLRIYRNGDQVASHAVSGAIVGSPQDVTVGNVNTQDDRLFTGTIDDVRLYSRSLSASEMHAIYSGTPTSPPAPDAGLEQDAQTSADAGAPDTVPDSGGSPPVDGVVSATCDYYASPTGTGNGLSQSSPFKISNFWSKASPGKTLCLLDGTYRGSDSIIDPPDMNGTAGNPITVRALNDGKASIDGQDVRRPVYIRYNDYFVLEGFNAHSSNAAVIEVLRSKHVIVRRVAAWDAADGNDTIVNTWNSDHVLFEDIAAWGIGRKVIGAASQGNNWTCRRCWGRWEGGHHIGPKSTIQLSYNNTGPTVENSISTWSGERMKQTYTLLCAPGSTNSKCGRTYSNYEVDQPMGLFRTTANAGVLNGILLGSLGYASRSDRFSGHSGVSFQGNVSALEVDNVAIHLDSIKYPNRHTFLLSNSSSGEIGDSTSIGGAGPTISDSWQQSNVDIGTNVDGITNVYTSSTGARICNRYKDRVLTNEPLWPWPMDQRIKDAMIQSGHRSVTYGMANDTGYVTDAVEQMFGPIPQECRGNTNR